VTKYKLLALFFLLSGCDQCNEGQFCHRYCQEQLGSQVEVNEGIGLSVSGRRCICEVGVLLPAQPKVEK